jgi:hypothetical protein
MADSCTYRLTSETAVAQGILLYLLTFTLQTQHRVIKTLLHQLYALLCRSLRSSLLLSAWFQHPVLDGNYLELSYIT